MQKIIAYLLFVFFGVYAVNARLTGQNKKQTPTHNEATVQDNGSKAFFQGHQAIIF